MFPFKKTAGNRILCTRTLATHLWYHAVANAGVQKILLLLLKGPNPLPETGVSIAKTARLLLFLQ